MEHGQLLINGHFIGGPCDSSVGREVIRNPYDQSIVGVAAEGGWPELKNCVDSAHAAFSAWRSEPSEVRASLLDRIAEKIGEEREHLANLLVREIGKPITQARGEVDRAALVFGLAAQEARRGSDFMSLDFDPRGKDYTAYVRSEPRGVVFGITPYNWPINLAAHKIAPALATGNTFVLKPSPLAPCSSMALVRLIHEAGCPPGVINVWNGPTPAVERALADPRVRFISFTGSAGVGWKLKERYWDRPITLECGGDAFVIISESADLAWAAQRTVFGAFAYAGQICISVQHALVQKSIYDAFLAQVVEITERSKSRDPLCEDTLCGPMISAEAAIRVQSWVKDAAEGGAEILCGGSRDKNIFAPTVLQSVPDASPLCREEAFAPVLCLHPYVSLDDAIARVNQSNFGIHAGFFGNRPDEIERAVTEIETAGVVINDVPTMRFDNLPYGGLRQSGFGREGVRWAMDSMTEPKSILQRKTLRA